MIHLRTRILAGKPQIPEDYILCYDFNGDFKDRSVNANNALYTAPPSFAAGRKGADYCAVFNGSQSVRTSKNLSLQSDKVSVSFWMQTTTANGIEVVSELSYDTNDNNSFSIFINNVIPNRVEVFDHGPGGYNLGDSMANVNTGAWVHVVVVIDRSQGINQNKIYVNNALSYVQYNNLYSDINGIFSDYTFYVGQRGGTSMGYRGKLQNFRIYKRVLNATEITQLYNE